MSESNTLHAKKLLSRPQMFYTTVQFTEQLACQWPAQWIFRQNIVVYARMLTNNDEVLWPQNLGAVAIANYTQSHYRHLSSNTHKYMLESINFTNNLNKTKTKHEQHDFTDI